MAISLVIRVMVGGLAFVHGAFAVIPLTAGAPILARRSGRRVIGGAIIPMVIIVVLQWTGSLDALWGSGRWVERDDATDFGDRRSTSLHEISWLGGQTSVLEEFAPG